MPDLEFPVWVVATTRYDHDGQVLFDGFVRFTMEDGAACFIVFRSKALAELFTQHQCGETGFNGWIVGCTPERLHATLQQEREIFPEVSLVAFDPVFDDGTFPLETIPFSQVLDYLQKRLGDQGGK